MRGHVRQRGKGNWYAVLDVRDPATGKRRRKWHSLQAKGKREAQIECARLIHEMSTGAYIVPSRATLAAYLEVWLADIKSRITPKTHLRYSELARKNIVPLLGETLLKDLQPAAISQAYASLLESGHRKGGGLSAGTVRHVHRLLKQALAQAVRWGGDWAISRNPCDAVKPPKAAPAKMHVHDVAQTVDLLEALRDNRLFPAVLLAVLCGLRRGEIAALRWGQVDLNTNTGSLAIVQSAEQTKRAVRYKEPKTGRARTVALSPMMVEELRAHRLRQAEELLRLGIRVTDETFVVARADGLPLQPDTLTQEWKRLVAKTGLPRIRFHDLRHSHATHLLASGVHPKIASERLGHSKVGITLDLYSHVLPGMQEDAVAKVDAAMQAARNKRETNR
jgi:integrase